MQDGERACLGGSGDEQVGHLAPTLMPCSEQALDLTRAAQVLGGGLDELEDLDGVREAVPLGGVARGATDL